MNKKIPLLKERPVALVTEQLALCLSFGLSFDNGNPWAGGGASGGGTGPGHRRGRWSRNHSKPAPGSGLELEGIGLGIGESGFG